MYINEFYFLREKIKKGKKKLTLRQDVFSIIYVIHICKRTPNSNTLIGHILTLFFPCFFFLEGGVGFSLIVDVRRL
jgi:hypothetical protein